LFAEKTNSDRKNNSNRKQKQQQQHSSSNSSHSSRNNVRCSWNQDPGPEHLEPGPTSNRDDDDYDDDMNIRKKGMQYLG